ncbi:Qat anti-phage system TatD family nuclease QatD [Flavobacterium subsaxonicum]|uniref:Hydrolase TatD n=1 Tax=Flavobacterium subsaxonicum WB 4.1-42 = DSM 21790 TaxID=1121898 RepID=A0A0A2MHR8_9FLAO|nr:Qat anti-phage system TatD family nuclease QatD [Flavobacterium subsaxonicum]KGO91013.1 hypothetical protein Q766_20195 [Flavobacterium subsaxonicum WB 4.1-42 = DSM 21790]
MLFDTHFHLDLTAMPDQTARAIENEKIYTIAVTNLPQLFLNTEKLCKGYKYIRPALGYHPELAAKYNNQLALFVDLIDRTRYIGEIGLDNQKKGLEDFKQQAKIFEKIINVCADNKNKILTLHSRKAEEQVISTIGNNYPGKVIMHWYSGSLKELERALSYGFYFSVNYNMTKSANGKKIIQKIPIERILLETDGPFTSFNNQPFSPAMLPLIRDAVCNIKDVSFTTCNNFLHTNIKKLLGE